MRAFIRALFPLSFLLANETVASTNESMENFFKQVNIECQSASGGFPVAVSSLVLFPDDTGIVGLIMKNEPTEDRHVVELLCLYNKKNHQAYVSDIYRK